MLSKIKYLFTFLVLSSSLFAQVEVKEEMSKKFDLGNGNELKVIKFFHEEPVSSPRKLVVTKFCPNGKEHILFNANGCDYKDFRLVNSSKLSFYLYKYDPATGQCLKKSEKPIEIKVTLPCL